MDEEELMIRSSIYAVEHLLLQGYRTYYTKDNEGTHRVDYTETLKYLQNKLAELKGDKKTLFREKLRLTERESDFLNTGITQC